MYQEWRTWWGCVELAAGRAAVVPPSSTGLLKWAQLATAQTLCKDLTAVHAKRLHHLVAVQVEGFPVWCDVSTGVWRPVVPKYFRQQVFDTQGYVPLHAWWALSQPAGMGQLTC